MLENKTEQDKPKVKKEENTEEEDAKNGCKDVALSENESSNDKAKLKTMSNSELEKQADCISNGNRKKEKQKKSAVNGLVRSLLSPETVQKECSLDSEIEPKPKKIKLENENELPAKEIKELLSDETPAKAPSEAPRSMGSPTSEETVASSTRLKPEPPEETTASPESENCNLERLQSPTNSTSDDNHTTKEKVEQQSSKEDVDEKKESYHNKKHKKKREKKKHRHHSGNDSTGSDVPCSPLSSQSSITRPSPTRSRISFDADLGKNFCQVFLSLEVLVISQEQCCSEGFSLR